jgi:hypothetical protein
VAHGFITALSGSQFKPPALPVVIDFYQIRSLWESIRQFGKLGLGMVPIRIAGYFILLLFFSGNHGMICSG